MSSRAPGGGKSRRRGFEYPLMGRSAGGAEAGDYHALAAHSSMVYHDYLPPALPEEDSLYYS